MLIIFYDPEYGKTVPDKKIDAHINAVLSHFAWARPMAKLTDWEDRVGSQVMVDAWRLAVKQGKIAHDEIQFKTDTSHSYVDKDGRLEDYMVLGDTWDNILNGLLE